MTRYVLKTLGFVRIACVTAGRTREAVLRIVEPHRHRLEGRRKRRETRIIRGVGAGAGPQADGCEERKNAFHQSSPGVAGGPNCSSRSDVSVKTHVKNGTPIPGDPRPFPWPEEARRRAGCVIPELLFPFVLPPSLPRSPGSARSPRISARVPG